MGWFRIRVYLLSDRESSEEGPLLPLSEVLACCFEHSSPISDPLSKLHTGRMKITKVQSERVYGKSCGSSSKCKKSEAIGGRVLLKAYRPTSPRTLFSPILSWSITAGRTVRISA